MTRRLDPLGCAIFVCMAAACQNDESRPAAAPTTGSADSAAMMGTGPSFAAGTRAAAAGGGSSAPSNLAGSPAVTAIAGRPAPPDTAGSPATSSSGTAGTGSAGMNVAPNPDANSSAAASCELPNTYTRAARLTLDLTWPETLGVLAGTGRFVGWAKAAYTRSSAGALELESRVCGLLMPEMMASDLAGGRKASPEIPLSAFDSSNMPVDRTMAAQSDPLRHTFAISMMLGTMLPDPNGKWPSSASLMPFDHDGDGAPGLTALLREGPDYILPPSSITQTEFLDRLYIAIRAQLRGSITPACSGAAEGTVEPIAVNFSVVGCHVKDRDDCSASELRFIAGQLPRYMVGSSGTWTEVEVPADASCADVRAALPPP